MTSSSSGQSGDDRWYESFQDLEVAPPLPSKVANQVSTSRTNNTYPSTPKRNNTNAHQISGIQVSSQGHNHYGPHAVQHSKIQVSHSLPLQHVNYSAPLTATLHNNTSDYELSAYKDKNNLLKQQNDRMRQENDYTTARAPKVSGSFVKVANFVLLEDD